MGTERLHRRPDGSTVTPVGAERQATPASRRVPHKGAGVPLPDELRSGVESLAGFALDDVRVQYNSAEPARLGALAYAQGATIHVAPGQEEHLPHEAWHVVQQAQGRISPSTSQLRGPLMNTSSTLEREAEVMGARASRIRPTTAPPEALRPLPRGRDIVQRMKTKDGKTAINTLTDLNDYLKAQNKGFDIIAERDFDEEPGASALNAAIAAAPERVDGPLTKVKLLAALNRELAKAKTPQAAKDPLAIRKEAAKKVRTWEKQYYGGPANELHVHDIGGAIHVKVGADDRRNIYVNGKLRKDALKDARIAISSHPLAATLNAAIDKALLAYGLELDTY
jgi:hypothetical protein